MYILITNNNGKHKNSSTLSTFFLEIVRKNYLMQLKELLHTHAKQNDINMQSSDVELST